MMMAKRVRDAVLALGFGALAATAAADTLLIDRIARSGADKPKRGMTMDAVLARFGEPSQRLAAVGGDRPQHPPITRWVYPEYTVYFERERVIDAVVNRSTPLEQGPKPSQ